MASPSGKPISLKYWTRTALERKKRTMTYLKSTLQKGGNELQKHLSFPSSPNLRTPRNPLFPSLPTPPFPLRANLPLAKSQVVTADIFSPVTRVHVTKFPYLGAE